MKKIHLLFLTGILLSFANINSCSRPSDDKYVVPIENDENNNVGDDGDGNTEFKESITLIIIKD